MNRARKKSATADRLFRAIGTCQYGVDAEDKKKSSKKFESEGLFRSCHFF